jgi:hypothetical protein
VKEKILALKKQNPDWGYGKIANELDCDKSTVKFHLNKEFAQKKNASRLERVRARKRELVQKMGGRCQKCGYSKCIAALEFHHLDSTQKEIELFRTSYSMERILEEAKKCVLLCCRCHREIENGELT